MIEKPPFTHKYSSESDDDKGNENMEIENPESWVRSKVDVDLAGEASGVKTRCQAQHKNRIKIK